MALQLWVFLLAGLLAQGARKLGCPHVAHALPPTEHTIMQRQLLRPADACLPTTAEVAPQLGLQYTTRAGMERGAGLRSLS